MSEVTDLEDVDVSGIAQYLSDLSQSGRLPSGVESIGNLAPFLSEDVNFSNNDWLNKTILIQGWLRLNAPISSTSVPFEAGTQLFEQVSPDPVEACLASDEEDVKLTPLGVQHLETWLSRAVANRESFLESIEDGRPLKLATEEWELLWEEAGANLAQQPASIQAEVQTLTIRNFSDYAKEEGLELNPSYQRDSVWSTSDSQLLIDSILRGIPIPSIILTQIENNDQLQIVDGKQRLTAILRFIGQHPAARAFAKKNNVEDLLEKDPKKLIKQLQLRGPDIPENYLPFRLYVYQPGDPLSNLSGKYYAEIRDSEIIVGQGKFKVRDIFEKAHSKYQIPVIIYEKTRLQDIHHVFSIYNKQGKKLNAEELRNATYHHLGLTKLLLVLSGDRPDADDLAPYLPLDVRIGISEVGAQLKDRGFGTLRFKRTKVLSWICALFLQPPNKGREGAYVTPSTAVHIDTLLKDISKKPSTHPLFQNTTLVSLARDLRFAVSLHAQFEDAWAPKFRSKKGQTTQWEELPLVASLVTIMALVASGNEKLIEANMSDIRDISLKLPSPTKSQNKTQWEYIANVCMTVLNEVKVDQDIATIALKKRYGYSCLEVMRSLSQNASV